MRRSDQYPCLGCGELVDGAEAASIWIDHELGYTCLRTHRSQECGRAALAASGGVQRAGNLPPLSAAEKAKRKLPPGDV